MSDDSKSMFGARLYGAKVAPRKARKVADLVRGLPVQSAMDILQLTNRKSAPMVSKLVKSAMANAMQQATVDVDRLVIKEIFVDEGVTLKRYLPRAQGRATPIRKRTSHITIKLAEI